MSTTSQRFDDLPGWAFAIVERSAGVYEATGTHEASGVSVSTGDYDPAVVIDRCRVKATETALR